MLECGHSRRPFVPILQKLTHYQPKVDHAWVWRIEFSREAAKAFLRMPRGDSLRIRRRLDELARDSLNCPNVKKLTEHPGFRLRVGDWRVVYLLDHGAVVIQVIRIAQRGEVHR